MTLKKTLVTMFVLMLVQQSVRCDKRNTFEITSVTCQFNEKYFADTLCEHHVNANGAKVVSGHLQLKQPLDTFEARVNVKVFWETSNGVQKKLIEVTEDFCQFLTSKMATMMLAAVIPLVRENGHIPSECPVKADTYYINDTEYETLSQKHLPIFMPAGNYIAESKSTYNNDHLATITSRVVVKHAP